MDFIAQATQSQMRVNVPEFRSGDTVRVHARIKEGDKERVQIFEGVVIARHNAGISSSFTVRKVSSGVGVERVFPTHSPTIERIEMVSSGKVRRARLNYLRELQGKSARIESKRWEGEVLADLANASGETDEGAAVEESAQQ